MKAHQQERIISKKILLILLAIDLLILKLQTIIPPNALTGSLAYAFSKDMTGDLFEETPHGFACLIITVVGIFFMDWRISIPAKISL